MINNHIAKGRPTDKQFSTLVATLCASLSTANFGTTVLSCEDNCPVCFVAVSERFQKVGFSLCFKHFLSCLATRNCSLRRLQTKPTAVRLVLCGKVKQPTCSLSLSAVFEKCWFAQGVFSRSFSCTSQKPVAPKPLLQNQLTKGFGFLS